MTKYKNLTYFDVSELAIGNINFNCRINTTDIEIFVCVVNDKIYTQSSVKDLIMELPFIPEENNLLFQVLDIVNDELTSYYQMVNDYEVCNYEV